MRISILSLFLAVALAGPLAFAEDQVAEDTVQAEEVIGPEALTEAADTQAAAEEKVADAQEKMVETDAPGEDCANSADDDGDEKVDCDDEDCAADPGCNSGS